MKKYFLVILLFIGLTSFSQLKIGDKAPDFKLWLSNGDIITQNETKGKVVVFKMWFTTCAPCVAGIKDSNALVNKYKNNTDIIFIAPAIDRSDIIRRFLSRVKFNFKVAYSAYDVIEKYNTKGIFPSYFIINKKGNIAYIDSQSNEIEAGILEAKIRDLLME